MASFAASAISASNFAATGSNLTGALAAAAELELDEDELLLLLLLEEEDDDDQAAGAAVCWRLPLGSPDFLNWMLARHAHNIAPSWFLSAINSGCEDRLWLFLSSFSGFDSNSALKAAVVS